VRCYSGSYDPRQPQFQFRIETVLLGIFFIKLLVRLWEYHFLIRKQTESNTIVSGTTVILRQYLHTTVCQRTRPEGILSFLLTPYPVSVQQPICHTPFNLFVYHDTLPILVYNNQLTNGLIYGIFVYNNPCSLRTCAVFNKPCGFHRYLRRDGREYKGRNRKHKFEQNMLVISCLQSLQPHGSQN
jgi:hypothetical protein